MLTGVRCDAQGLKPRGSGQLAYELLFETVENYFMNGCQDFNPKVRCTDLPSIYFQHPGILATLSLLLTAFLTSIFRSLDDNRWHRTQD